MDRVRHLAAFAPRVRAAAGRIGGPRMCILTLFKPGVTPDLLALRAGAAANPDGHGYAVVADGRILTGHGLDPDAVIDQFATVRAEFPDTAALFHSRLATHGAVCADNCHPFVVGGDERTVLAH